MYVAAGQDVVVPIGRRAGGPADPAPAMEMDKGAQAPSYISRPATPIRLGLGSLGLTHY